MQLLDRFGQVRKEFRETVSSFPQDKLEEPVCGEWDIKDVLAHIAGWDTYFTTIVRLLRTGKDVPYRGDKIQQWNHAMVKESKGKTWDQVRDEFVGAGRVFLEEYGSLQEELWSRRFWERRAPTPAWLVKHNANHYEEHKEEIVAKLGEWA